MGGQIQLARQHVLRGRAIVARQRKIIATIRSLGRDHRDAEELLAQFERSLAIFEADLVQLEKLSASRPH
jgi:hypothetical protein